MANSNGYRHNFQQLPSFRHCWWTVRSDAEFCSTEESVKFMWTWIRLTMPIN